LEKARDRSVKTIRCLAVLGACLSLALAGCGGGGGGVKAKGKVTVKGGGDLVIPKGAQLVVVFIPEEKAADTYPANFPDAAKTDFEVSGKENKGIPPGKYKVTVELNEYGPPAGKKDLLGGKYAAGKTPIHKEVTGPDVGAIEVDAPENK